ncbi:dihydrofolate reductase family protein [Niabella sp. CC-SYL272]|uniref:dihydrofolate reductase family protein n=1 Tax=Niabella agricola TaxID=2891571 RepID=UPI001F19BF17|nr:dihydrofolate reductase family protein [Niabella agricola]MCF3108015.1 dihydrofolate reductase family protein [Niabella agricola]
MRKLIAGINMTLDGFCDHTAIIPDDELHQHYADLLRSADVILYGRITYQLMEYWPTVVKNPTGNPETDDFARVMDKIPKVVFSHTLKKVHWASTRLAKGTLEEEVAALKQSADGRMGDILVGSRSLIIALLNLNLIDEFQLTIHPVVAGSGLPLFNNIDHRAAFKLINTKTFGSGAITLYYEPLKK